MSTLSQVLRSFRKDNYQFEISLDDGAQDWFAETLLGELTQEEGSLKAFVGNHGVYAKDDGRLLYTIKDGKWNNEGEFEEEGVKE